MEYRQYQAEDFAADESFQNWFLHQQEAESKFWKNWITQNPDRQNEIEQAKKLLGVFAVQVTPSEIKNAFQELDHQLDSPAKVFPIKKRNLNFRKWWSVAAVFFIAFAGAVFYFSQKHTPDWEIAKTDFGNLRQVYLPDSSFVFLNSNSILKFDKKWNSNTPREVWLDGEAFFEIRKKPITGTSKFIVHSGKADVAVLGTSFNVFHRNNEVAVVLQTGKVEFRFETEGKKQYLKMQPNDHILLDAKNKITHLNNVETKLYTSWRDQKLILKKTSLAKVFDALRDNFGYQVVLKNQSVLERKITATIPIKDVDILLEALREIYQLDIKKDSNRILIE